MNFKMLFSNVMVGPSPAAGPASNLGSAAAGAPILRLLKASCFQEDRPMGRELDTRSSSSKFP